MQFFHPETLHRISRLELRAKQIVDGFMSGLHQSKHFGNSVEFRQHRQYVPGDDLRGVDWKVWARHDRLYVKQYEIDTNLRLTLCVDVSPSMLFQSGAMSKYEYACTAAVSLAYLALRQNDAVAAVAFDGQTQTALPPKTKRTQLNAVIDLLLAARKTSAEPPAPFALNSLLTKRSGLVILLSDLFFERRELFDTLRSLKQNGHDVIVLHVMDAMELDFQLRGAVRFDGLELPLQLQCSPQSLRKDYQRAVNAFLDEIRQGCAELHCDYTLMRTDAPLDAALAAYLGKRQ